MKQKERFDEKPKQEHTEPKHHRTRTNFEILEKCAQQLDFCAAAW